VIVRRSFSEACRDGDLIATMRDMFTIRRRGQIVDVPFARLSCEEVREFAAALRVAADEIEKHAESMLLNSHNVTSFAAWLRR
jgi:hypothetical protein